jgi:hypothetical protein
MFPYRLIVPICAVGIPLVVLAMAEPQDSSWLPLNADGA